MSAPTLQVLLDAAVDLPFAEVDLPPLLAAFAAADGETVLTAIRAVGERLSETPRTTAIFNHQRYLLMGSSLNMTYRGDMNREYVVCRGCGQVEHQYSAEARDQAREAAPPANRRIQLNRRKAATRRR